MSTVEKSREEGTHLAVSMLAERAHTAEQQLAQVVERVQEMLLRADPVIGPARTPSLPHVLPVRLSFIDTKDSSIAERRIQQLENALDIEVVSYQLATYDTYTEDSYVLIHPLWMLNRATTAELMAALGHRLTSWHQEAGVGMDPVETLYADLQDPGEEQEATADFVRYRVALVPGDLLAYAAQDAVCFSECTQSSLVPLGEAQEEYYDGIFEDDYQVYYLGVDTE